MKVGLEATSHYSNNLLASLVNKGFPTVVINPLHTNLYRKGLSLRKTKTDKVDASSIAMMLMANRTLKPYSETSYHNEELKSLTRYRFDKVHERSKLKSSLARLVNILFPELEKLVPSLHLNSVYTLLEELPGADYIAGCHLTHLKKLLESSSKGRYSRDKAIEIRNAAIDSIGTPMDAKSMMTMRILRIPMNITIYPRLDIIGIKFSKKTTTKWLMYIASIYNAIELRGCPVLYGSPPSHNTILLD